MHEYHTVHQLDGTARGISAGFDHCLGVGRLRCDRLLAADVRARGGCTNCPLAVQGGGDGDVVGVPRVHSLVITRILVTSVAPRLAGSLGGGIWTN